MQQTFTCPHCHKSIEITEALTHQIESDITADLEKKHKQTLEIALLQSERKIKQELEEKQILDLKDTRNELNELRQQKTKQANDLLAMTRNIRALKDKDEQRELEMEKMLNTEREKIRQEISRQSDEEYRLKDLEKEKKIKDMEHLVEELKRKAQQGSMQTQGEVLELDLEETLRQTFPHDEINPVEKGVSGADIKQIVKTPRGNVCGVILWEFKRTKHWEDKWIEKLKHDVRSSKANIGSIVSQALPLSLKTNIEFYNGIWVASYANILPLALLLRKNLIDVATQKFISKDSANKAQGVYDYITSHEFRQQIESLVEIYSDMTNQVLKERIAFQKSWEIREKQVKRLFMSTANIIGGMEGSGASIPQIKGLELLELDETSSLEKTKLDQPTLLD